MINYKLNGDFKSHIILGETQIKSDVRVIYSITHKIKSFQF